MTEFLTHHRKKLFIVFLISALLMVGLCAQLGFLMIARSDHYSKMADELHKRERTIKAARGEIVDRNGTVIAANRTVCTVSVIHNQVTEPEKVIRELVRILELPEPEVRKKVEKWSSREIIRTNVEKSVGDQIMNLGLSGVKVDEDYKRYYPYGSLASKVLGFTGADNQGIIGLEVKYERYLKGRDGLILTTSDAKGTELQNAAEERVEPVPGNTLTVSLDVNIQKYAEQAAYQVMEKKGAKAVSVIVMDPRNGEIYAMVNVPEFDLNDPFTLNVESGGLTGTELQDARNKMWRNRCINDTYEPGSTFKIITAAAVNQYAALAKILDAYRKGDTNTAVLTYVDMDQSKITDDSSVAILNEIKADMDANAPTVLMAAAAQSNSVGDYDSALRYYERYMEFNDKNPEVIYNMGMVYKAKGDTDNANQMFGQVIMNFADSEFAEKAKEERGY